MYQPAPLPPNEKQRLETLRRYAILDTPQEPAFNRVTSLVTRLLKVPMATVTLVDEHRQWFKAFCGLDQRETSRDIAFCSHAILSDEMLVIPDATKDPRFAENPLVTGPVGLRFYAGMPLKGFDGSNIGVLCAIDTRPRKFGPRRREILRDLAGVVNSELQLRLETLDKTRLATAIHHVKAGVVLTDAQHPDNPFVFCNPAYSAITGYAPEEVLGRTFGMLRGPGSDNEVYEEFRKAVAERRTFRGVSLCYHKSGTPFWNEILINPVFDASGQVISFVGIQHDVTERKRAEDELKASYERLKELETLRDNLTHMIIHDLRAPLSVVLGFLGLLEMGAATRNEEEEKEAIAKAQEGAHQINTMITSLLDISRLEAGKMPLQSAKSDLREIASLALDKELALLGPQRLQLEIPGEAVMVFCDREVVSRVITNLVGNSLKFSPPDSPVTVNICWNAEYAWFAVRDEGPGIPPESHRRIFEKFGQLKGTRHIHSTGLGLTFCRLAVEAHEGQIGVESEVGKGSTFWFTLPLAERED